MNSWHEGWTMLEIKHLTKTYGDLVAVDDVTMTIIAREGLQIVVPMRITEGEMKRVQELQKFMNDLTRDRILTEAQADVLRGHAKMLSESHIRVDATNLPDTHMHVWQKNDPNNIIINNNNNNNTAIAQ